MENIDIVNKVLECLTENPLFDQKITISIQALSPLSFVSSTPGDIYRSSSAPTKHMILGMLENAIGLHFPDDERTQTNNPYLKKIIKKTGALQSANSGFTSLLQNHVRILYIREPHVERVVDLFSQHLRGSDERHTKGSRNFDWRVIPHYSEAITKETSSRYLSSFPQYYISQAKREYVIPLGVYEICIETSNKLSECIEKAIEYPAAPLYLGTNDGWVEVGYRRQE